MTKKEWDALPNTITVRIIRSHLSIKGFRTQDIWIVTTLRAFFFTIFAPCYATSSYSENRFREYGYSLIFSKSSIRCWSSAGMVV